MSHCPARHTHYQPNDDEWKCPNCGYDQTDKFYITCPATDSIDCEKLHVTDEVCDNCKSFWWGDELAEAMAELADQVVCPHCGGKGTIPRSKL